MRWYGFGGPDRFITMDGTVAFHFQHRLVICPDNVLSNQYCAGAATVCPTWPPLTDRQLLSTTSCDWPDHAIELLLALIRFINWAAAGDDLQLPLTSCVEIATVIEVPMQSIYSDSDLPYPRIDVLLPLSLPKVLPSTLTFRCNWAAALEVDLTSPFCNHFADAAAVLISPFFFHWYWPYDATITLNLPSSHELHCAPAAIIPQLTSRQRHDQAPAGSALLLACNLGCIVLRYCCSYVALNLLPLMCCDWPAAINITFP